MNHAKRGYVLFLLFTMLSVCTVLVSLYFSKVVIYRQFIGIIAKKEKLNYLVQSCPQLFQALINTAEQKESNSVTIPAENAQQAQQSLPQKIMLQLLKFLNTDNAIPFTQENAGFEAIITINVQSEQGKLNINSLYDFEKKKFLFEGTPQDRKKLCTWLFEKIATITNKPSLFSAFEKNLQQRTFDFNDVCELLAIKEFREAFNDHIFLNSEQQGIFLTDIFTTNTEQDTINPWLFSPSWCKILDLKPKKNLTDQERKKLISSLNPKPQWETDWNTQLKDFYQKDFKDLSTEIKTILTTEFEANIFSLLLKANMAETSSTILTILKMKAKDHLMECDIMKNYQV